MFRVIIATLATSSYLILAGGLRDYFTFVLFLFFFKYLIF